MDIASDIKRIVEAISCDDCARCLHMRLMLDMAQAGYSCKREVRADYQGRKRPRRGRIDILAHRDGKRIGIEVDNEAPRPRSVLKLRGLDLDYRFIVLRGNRGLGMQIAGIDGIFTVSQERGLGRTYLSVVAKQA